LDSLETRLTSAQAHLWLVSEVFGKVGSAMGKYDEYKKHWKRRAERARRRRQALAAEARLEARRLGDLLVRQFGATRVYLFGSLTQDGAFHERSDIDLAAEGLAPTSFEAGVALDRVCDYR